METDGSSKAQSKAFVKLTQGTEGPGPNRTVSSFHELKVPRRVLSLEPLMSDTGLKGASQSPSRDHWLLFCSLPRLGKLAARHLIAHSCCQSWHPGCIQGRRRPRDGPAFLS